MTETELPTLEKLYRGSSEAERSAEGHEPISLEPLSETAGAARGTPLPVLLPQKNKSRALRDSTLEWVEGLGELAEAVLDVLLDLFLI